MQPEQTCTILKLIFEGRSRALPINKKAEHKEFEAMLLDTEVEAWNLLILFIRDMFHELSMLRAEGVVAEKMDEGSLDQQVATVLFTLC
jgi:hypothetical protein